MECRLVTIPSMLVAGLRHQARQPRGASIPGLLDHWRRFHDWRERYGVASCVDDIVCIAYAPPVPYGADTIVDLCVPVRDTWASATDPPARTQTIAGHFVLAAGTLDEIPALLHAARAHASSLGLAFERGSIEIYRPGEDAASAPTVDVGVRIHD